jgi:hypothetical protein
MRNIILQLLLTGLLDNEIPMTLPKILTLQHRLPDINAIFRLETIRLRQHADGSVVCADIVNESGSHGIVDVRFHGYSKKNNGVLLRDICVSQVLNEANGFFFAIVGLGDDTYAESLV